MKKWVIRAFVSVCLITHVEGAEKEARPNLLMLKRLGIDQIEVKNPSFGIAVVDFGDIYADSRLSHVIIEPGGLPPITAAPPRDANLHGFKVCSVIRQLHPKVKIYYYKTGSTHSAIKMALENPEVKIVNCSFAEHKISEEDREVFKLAQDLKKFLIFASDNHEGFLGLNLANQYLFELSQNNETKKSFGVAGGSEDKSGIEEASNYFIKSGALRSHYLIAPGKDVPVFLPFNDQKYVSGTSFSVPHIIVSMVYLMTNNPGLCPYPYEAWMSLCANADTPRMLKHASLEDQGWGYLNLKNALASLNNNRLIDSIFSKVYDAHMQRPIALSIEDVKQHEYPQSFTETLRGLDQSDEHVMQLLRTTLYERGIYLVAIGKFADGLALLEEAKSLGINHTDPLSTPYIKQRLLTDQKYQDSTLESKSRWHKGMLAIASCWGAEVNESDFDDLHYSSLNLGLHYEYLPAKEVFANKISSWLRGFKEEMTPDLERYLSRHQVWNLESVDIRIISRLLFIICKDKIEKENKNPVKNEPDNNLSRLLKMFHDFSQQDLYYPIQSQELFTLLGGNSLTGDIWFHIAQYLPPKDLCCFSLTSKRFAGGCGQNSIFKDFTLNIYTSSVFTNVSFFEKHMGVPSSVYGKFITHLIHPGIKNVLHINTAVKQLGLWDKESITLFCNQHKNLLKPNYLQQVTPNYLKDISSHLTPPIDIETLHNYWVIYYLTKQEITGETTKILFQSFNQNTLSAIEEINSTDPSATKLELPPISHLPIEVTRLTALEELDASGSGDYSKTNLTFLPSYITQLRNLTNLSVSCNHLTVFPEPVLNLPKLQTLSLQGNKLIDLPNTIDKLMALESLILDFNAINVLPATIGNLSSLKEFRMPFNKLTRIPKEIGLLNALEKLHISANCLEFLPNEICNLSQLTELNLDHNKLTRLPETIGSLANLKVLTLDHNPELTIFYEGLTPENKYKMNIKPVSILNLTKLKYFTYTFQGADQYHGDQYYGEKK